MNIQKVSVSERYFSKLFPILLFGMTLTAFLQGSTDLRAKVIKASSTDVHWNESVASLVFYLKPLFWQTTWTYMLCSNVLVLTATAAYRLRIRRGRSELKAVLGERTRIAREFHDSLAQALAGVVLHLETAMIQSSGEQSKHHLNRALNLARMSIDEVKRTVGELRQQMDSQTDFVSAIKQEATRQTSESSLELAFEVKGTARILPDAVKSNMLRICQEAIHNAIQHANAKSVHVSVIFNTSELAFCIKDDGSGFNADSAPKNGHFGLIGMKERVNIMGGTIQIHSHPGQGVEILVSVPFTNYSSKAIVHWYGSSAFLMRKTILGMHEMFKREKR